MRGGAGRCAGRRSGESRVDDDLGGRTGARASGERCVAWAPGVEKTRRKRKRRANALGRAGSPVSGWVDR